MNWNRWRPTANQSSSSSFWTPANGGPWNGKEKETHSFLLLLLLLPRLCRLRRLRLLLYFSSWTVQQQQQNAPSVKNKRRPQVGSSFGFFPSACAVLFFPIRSARRVVLLFWFFFGGFSFFLPRRRPKSIRRVLVLTNAFARLSELPFFFVQTQFETSTTNQRPVLSLDSWSTSAFSFIIHQKKRCSFSRNGHHDSPSGREERNDSRGLLSLADLCRKNLFGELSPVGVVVLFLREGGGVRGRRRWRFISTGDAVVKIRRHTHTHS